MVQGPSHQQVWTQQRAQRHGEAPSACLVWERSWGARWGGRSRRETARPPADGACWWHCGEQ